MLSVIIISSLLIIIIIIIILAYDPRDHMLPRVKKIIIITTRAIVEASISDPRQMARFLAAVAAHSGDWLLALPVSSCGLRLADDAVRVAVALRLDIVVWR